MCLKVHYNCDIRHIRSSPIAKWLFKTSFLMILSAGSSYHGYTLWGINTSRCYTPSSNWWRHVVFPSENNGWTALRRPLV